MAEISQPEELYSINVNQSQDFASIGTSKGFYVYSLNPLKRFEFQSWFNQGFEGGIGLVTMLFRTNIFLLRGVKKNKFSSKQIMIWDSN